MLARKTRAMKTVRAVGESSPSSNCHTVSIGPWPGHITQLSASGWWVEPRVLMELGGVSRPSLSLSCWGRSEDEPDNNDEDIAGDELW